MHKKYKIFMSRTYNTVIEMNFPDDGRDHAEIINDKIEDQDHEIWDLIAEAELFQMNVDNEDWEIKEINQTTTGALSQDTGPF